MIEIIEDNKEFNYKIYRSSVVLDNHAELIRSIKFGIQTFREYFPEKAHDSTWAYYLYNTFTITSYTQGMYDLFGDVVSAIDDYTNKKRPLWFQCWINYHKPEEVLKWHGHEYPCHGYVCIDPKETHTVYDGYKIKNEIGNIYIGPGFRRHKVVVDHDYNLPRITLGFDIVNEPSNNPVKMNSFIPVL